MKIGILTFQFADNHGALLQAYALKKYISKRTDAQVEIINYANRKLIEAYDINPFKNKKISRIMKAFIKYPFCRRQVNLFERFRREKLGILNPRKINTELYDEYDCYIVGSDQIWNSQITFDDYNYFLVDISSKAVKRIAYAASADDAFLMDIDYERKVELLKRFDAVSVRESQISYILKKKAAIESEIVLDPVFLLNDNEWYDMAKHPKRKIQEKYILYYSLKENHELDRIAKYLSVTMKLPIVVVHPTLRKVTSVGYPVLDIGPEEFVWLLKNAEIVVSNSFHAFSFSYIFGKKIYFDYVEESSNRIINLITIFNLHVVREDSINYIEMNNHNKVLFEKYLKQSKMFIERNIVNKTK